MNPPAIRAVLFDHDGTLVDSEGVHQQLWTTVLARHGHSFSSDQYKAHYAGVPTRANASDMVSRFGIDAAPAALVAEKEAALEAYLAASAFPLMPGARDAVQSLHERGVALGIVTGAGASAVHVTVARHFAPSPFRTIVSGDDVARSKPDPDCYRLAVQRLGLDAAECVAIEDTATGLAAAHAAGLRCIVVPHALSSHHDVSRAAYVASDLADAVAWLFPDAAPRA